MNCKAKFLGINSTKTEKITLTKVCKYYFSPHVRELGFRNPGNFFLVKPGILGFGIVSSMNLESY